MTRTYTVDPQAPALPPGQAPSAPVSDLLDLEGLGHYSSLEGVVETVSSSNGSSPFDVVGRDPPSTHPVPTLAGPGYISPSIHSNSLPALEDGVLPQAGSPPTARLLSPAADLLSDVPPPLPSSRLPSTPDPQVQLQLLVQQVAALNAQLNGRPQSLPGRRPPLESPSVGAGPVSAPAVFPSVHSTTSDIPGTIVRQADQLLSDLNPSWSSATASRGSRDPDASHARELLQAPALDPRRTIYGLSRSPRDWWISTLQESPDRPAPLAFASSGPPSDGGGPPSSPSSSSHSGSSTGSPPSLVSRIGARGGGGGDPDGSEGGGSDSSSSSKSTASPAPRPSRARSKSRSRSPVNVIVNDNSAVLAAVFTSNSHQKIRHSTVIPALGGTTSDHLYSWLLNITQALTHEAWIVDGRPITEFSSEDAANSPIFQDFATALTASAKKCPAACDRVTALIRSQPGLDRHGPRLLAFIMDDFSPLGPEYLLDRLSEFEHAVQGSLETAISFYERVKFLAVRCGRALGRTISDAAIKERLYFGSRRGAYRNGLTGIQKDIASGKRLWPDGKTFFDCTAQEFAKVLDDYQRSPLKNKFSKDGTLTAGEAVEYFKPQAPTLTFKSVDSASAPSGLSGRSRGARRVGRSTDDGNSTSGGSTPAPAPSTGTETGFDEFFRSTKKWHNGKFTTEDHLKFNKTFACPNCLTLKADARQPPPGWHHMAACPFNPPGNTIKFDHAQRTEDMTNGNGFAPTSRHTTSRPPPRAPTPGRRAAADTETPAPEASATPSKSSSDANLRPLSPVDVNAHPALFASQATPTGNDCIDAPAPRVTFAYPLDTLHIYDDSKEREVEDSINNNPTLLEPVAPEIHRSTTPTSPELAPTPVEPVAPEIPRSVTSASPHPTTEPSALPHLIYPFADPSGRPTLPLPARFVPLRSTFSRGYARAAHYLSDSEAVCIDSGAVYSMSGNRTDFVSLAPVESMTICAANGSLLPVEGIGTVRLYLQDKLVEENNWLFVPGLTMRLKSVRVHRRLHPDNCFLATHDECILGYPTFSLDIDDTEDCLLPCKPAPDATATPDFTDPGHYQPLEQPSQGMAFGATLSHRQFTPFPHSAGSFQELRTRDPTSHPSTRDVPSQYVPDSASPVSKRYSSEELHKLFGNRRILDWSSFADVCQGGKVVDLGEAPPSIGDFVNIKRGKRGKKAKVPPPGHTLCMDIGFGDGISPGGHRYCLVVVDAGSRMCWCYGLRGLSGPIISLAFQQLFIDMGADLGNSPVRRVLCDFDTKLITGKARNFLTHKEIRILSSAPYRQSQNGLVESHWATGVRMARAYLQEANLPKRFWFWALRTAFERMNMLPLEIGKDEENKSILSTPFELFYKRKPDMRTLFRFGSVGYFRRESDSVDGHKTARTNFQAQTLPGIALGRSNQTNAMIFWSPESSRFSVSADYKLDTDRQVRTHWPDLLNDGGFTISFCSHEPDADHSARFSVGDIIVFQPEGPCNADGEGPLAHGMVISVPIQGQQTNYRVEMPDGKLVDLPADSLMDLTDLDDYQSLFTLPVDDTEDPAQGDPHHPWRPDWLRPGQAITYYHNGDRQRGYLELSENFRWAFTQKDEKGRRVTEIELPDLSTNWKEYLDDHLLEVGHSPSHWAHEGPKAGPSADTATLAEPLNRGTTRSGKHFRGHARHVSAKGLTRPTPQFLWQSMRFPKNSPDYQIWLDSYAEEHDGLNSLNTYDVIDEAAYQALVAKHGIEAIPTMCIHTVKTDAQGKPERAKSRTVVLGNEEHRYWEKNDLFAPVIAKHSVRALVAYGISLGRRTKQCDAKNAFCHPELPPDEVCVVRPPKGCPFSAPGTYWKLNKTLYGLRRSPRHWYQTFSKALMDMGFTKCPHDPCVFKGTSPTGGTIFFGMYVDDSAYFGTDDQSEAWFEKELGSRLNLEFMGDLSYYLGVHYVWGYTSDGRLTVHLSQAGHIHKLLDKHGMASADEYYPVKTPYRSGLVIDSLQHDDVDPKGKAPLVQKYQSLVGSFNWLSTSTRPDITTVTSLLASHLRNPSQGHLDSALQVVRYLKGTPHWGIRYTQPGPTLKGGGPPFDPESCLKGAVAWPTKEDGIPKLASFNRLDTYTDSNWGPQDASHPQPGQTVRDEDMHSLLGCIVTYMGGPIDWRATRERRISPSVCESEIKAMSEGHKMVMGLRNFFEDLDAQVITEPTPFLYCDNKGSVTWIHSEVVSRNMRQFNIRQCALRESVRHKEIDPVHMPGHINNADLMTKEMRDVGHYLQLRSASMNCSPEDVDGTETAVQGGVKISRE